MIRWAAAVVLAVLLTLAVPSTADQRPDGFGGRGPEAYKPGFDPTVLMKCSYLGLVRATMTRVNGPSTFEFWRCEPGGTLVFWPIPCAADPLTTCKET